MSTLSEYVIPENIKVKMFIGDIEIGSYTIPNKDQDNIKRGMRGSKYIVDSFFLLLIKKSYL